MDKVPEVVGNGPENADAPGTLNKKKVRLRRGRPRKRIPLSEAMRRAGIDEYQVAERMAGLISGLETKGNDARVLLEALRESTRLLKQLQPSLGLAPVKLSHNVPRPIRDLTATQGETESH